MRLARLFAVVLLASMVPGSAFAQSSGGGGSDRRFTAGVVWQGGTFGDDSPRSANPHLGLVVGLGYRRDPTGLAGLSFDLAFEPIATRNPHFNERVRPLHLAIGMEIGRRIYVRPMIGAVVNVWSGDTQQTLGLGPSLGVAVGFERRTRGGRSINPEWVTRGSFEWGAYTWSSGIQLAIGAPSGR
jgi:hypothetical protein